MQITAQTPLISYFYHWEKTKPEAIFLRQPFGETWKDYSWLETGRQARKLAAYLRSLQLPPQSLIGLVSKNCAEWIISDLAIMMAGHVSVPFFPNLTADQINLVLNHSGCKVLLVGKLDDWGAMKGGIPAGVQCISFPTYNPDPAHTQWSEAMAMDPISDSPVNKLDDLVSIIYTSGTTGNPKGVMLTVGCMSAVLADLNPQLMPHISPARFISYMPLCHIAERGVLETNALAIGATVYFVESLDTFSKNLVDASPTHFGSVPRIWVKFQQGILAKMSPQKLNLLLSIPIVNNLIRKKIRTALGFKDTQVFLVGAAPMPDSLIKWFRRLGFPIQNLYAMTENTAGATLMPRHAIKDGTVGKPLPNAQIKIAPESGEICTKAPYNMLGYYKEPVMTAETIDADGWLHTGDVGEFDKEGYLKVTGRVKEMYKTSKGEYISPAQIEVGYAENTYVEQVCVVGESLPQPIALAVLSDLAKGLEKEEIASSLNETRIALNEILKPYERVHKVIVMPEPWTVENNKMTPTLKIKRKEVEKAYASQFEKWYDQKEDVIWG